MAEIDIQRKSGTSWIWWVIGLVVLALIVWWIAAAADDDADVVEAPGAVAAPVEAMPAAPAVGMTIAAVLADPAAYVGQTYSQTGLRVAEVPTDRGFWVEHDGARMFAILIDEPRERPLDINAGQTIDISQATVRDRTYLPQIAGVPLDADTQRIAEAQPAFLVVDERNVTVTQSGGM